MFRSAITGAVVLVVVVALALAGGALAGGNRSGIEGEVIDATCYGPCIAEGSGKPYAGKATIVAEPRSQRAQRSETAVDNGGFRARLHPGRYAVEVRIDDPCWVGDSDRLKVHRGEFRHLQLEVSNDCIR